MVIMFIFLFLSILFVIGTVVYLNYKKKNTSIKANIPKANQGNNSKKSKKKLSDILKIKISGNMLNLGNRYSLVIRLGNIDYNMLSNSEQDAIESILIQTALAIDYPVQFFSTTEYIDTSKVIATIKENKTNNINIQEHQNSLIGYLQRLMENKSVSVITNYAVISYDGLYENAIEELNRKALAFTNNLLRAKIVCEILKEDDLYNLLYRELNKNSALNIDNLKEGVKNLYVGKKQKRKKAWNKHIW